MFNSYNIVLMNPLHCWYGCISSYVRLCLLAPKPLAVLIMNKTCLIRMD